MVCALAIRPSQPLGECITIHAILGKRIVRIQMCSEHTDDLVFSRAAALEQDVR